jgi:hypothetical protein
VSNWSTLPISLMTPWPHPPHLGPRHLLVKEVVQPRAGFPVSSVRLTGLRRGVELGWQAQPPRRRRTLTEGVAAECWQGSLATTQLHECSSHEVIWGKRPIHRHPASVRIGRKPSG